MAQFCSLLLRAWLTLEKVESLRLLWPRLEFPVSTMCQPHFKAWIPLACSQVGHAPDSSRIVGCEVAHHHTRRASLILQNDGDGDCGRHTLSQMCGLAVPRQLTPLLVVNTSAQDVREVRCRLHSECHVRQGSHLCSEFGQARCSGMEQCGKA